MLAFAKALLQHVLVDMVAFLLPAQALGVEGRTSALSCLPLSREIAHAGKVRRLVGVARNR